MKRAKRKSSGIAKDLASAERLVGRALRPFKQVTFSIELFAHHLVGQGAPLISSQVTLWFGQTFKHSVRGGDDFVCLAAECRNQAERKLGVIRAMAKAAK